MTKKQRKERAVLLLAYSLISQYRDSLIYNNKDNLYDLKLKRLVKQLDLIAKSFANKKIERFLVERISKVDVTEVEIDPFLVAFYLLEILFKTNKVDFNLNIKDIVEVREALENTTELKANSLNYAISLYESINPESKGFLEFFKLRRMQ